jgi:hypothetical protein
MGVDRSCGEQCAMACELASPTNANVEARGGRGRHKPQAEHHTYRRRRRLSPPPRVSTLDTQRHAPSGSGHDLRASWPGLDALGSTMVRSDASCGAVLWRRAVAHPSRFSTCSTHLRRDRRSQQVDAQRPLETLPSTVYILVTPYQTSRQAHASSGPSPLRTVRTSLLADWVQGYCLTLPARWLERRCSGVYLDNFREIRKANVGG